MTLTGLQPNTEVRAYLGTDPQTAVEIAGVENSGTSFSFSQSVAGQDGYIRVFALEFLNQTINLTYSANDVSIPVTQTPDRQYENP